MHFAIFPPRADPPPGDILQCCIHQIALGELVNTRVYRKAQKRLRKEKTIDKTQKRNRYVTETEADR
ncbi:MAG: hypothetical protein B6D56_04480 [Candidatus Omnitrophica bacterium 4484_70.1]|nr:MAG: hypothetical protein B6D56_04480 [Candidatus Omnitrophica bacterium 4484_70.1]